MYSSAGLLPVQWVDRLSPGVNHPDLRSLAVQRDSPLSDRIQMERQFLGLDAGQM